MYPALFAWGSTGKINDASQAIKTSPLKGEVLRMIIPPAGRQGKGLSPLYGALCPFMAF